MNASGYNLYFCSILKIWSFDELNLNLCILDYLTKFLYEARQFRNHSEQTFTFYIKQLVSLQQQSSLIFNFILLYILL